VRPIDDTDDASSAETDEGLVERFRRDPSSEESRMALGQLYRRYFEKVARWSLRLATDRDDATDLAQEVFVRVQERLHTFRGEARFQTWLYTVARSVALNRADARRRRPTEPLEDAMLEAEPAGEESEPIESRLDTERLRLALHRALREDLEPLEAQVLWLHFAHGWTVPHLSRRYALSNKSGAKAILVSGVRKLRRSFARTAGGGGDGVGGRGQGAPA
jgi:RNA polymerase sigma-70 factor (ECF subfamily)